MAKVRISNADENAKLTGKMGIDITLISILVKV